MIDPELPDLTRAQVERLIAIDFRAYFLGEFRRADLARRFHVTGASVTRDIAYYREKLGGKVELNTVTKTYVAASDFEPIFTHNVGRALMVLSRGVGEGLAGGDHPLLPCEVPPAVSLPRAEILAPIARAIHRHRPVRMRYHSFSSGARVREAVPYALADNGLRWHIRAYDRLRREFIDFVLTRIESAEELVTGTVDSQELPQNDLLWTRVIELELVPHPKETHFEIVAMDYQMTDGVCRVRVRAALASYMLRQWIVDCTPDHSLTGTEYRLWLRNTPALYGVPNAHLAPGYVERGHTSVQRPSQ